MSGRRDPVRSRHPVLTYTVLRLLVFATALGVLYLLGARGVLLLGLALLVSGLSSLWLLSAQRDAMSAALHGRAQGFRGRLDAGAASEDVDDDPADDVRDVPR